MNIVESLARAMYVFHVQRRSVPLNVLPPMHDILNNALVTLPVTTSFKEYVVECEFRTGDKNSFPTYCIHHN